MISTFEHWNTVYATRSPTEVSWFQPQARVSLELVQACGRPLDAAILDVGAGASTLVDGLIERGFTDITLLDIAETAFADTRQRLHDAPVQYLEADVTTWKPARAYDIWHDRAVFHFLTDRCDRDAYKATVAAAVAPGGHVLIGTFSPDGPERCSGLPVKRYSAATLVEEFSGLLTPVGTRAESHITPSGVRQSFVFVRFARL